eukprot:comp11697_c0_seq1/m.6245 comp11697_c0_seq1/g.6245  ORF comp11697_c0_seq1/g.6245 comp11697_c0_seq1/m.6245 type:complete len:411 (-) comp11697_c0_seq1:156-1388(-)
MSSTLRQRFVSSNSGTDLGRGLSLDTLRSIDAYPKTIEDFRVKTRAGGLVSVISGLFMIVLFVSELRYFLSTEVTDELRVDTSRGEKMRINIDVTMHNLPCPYLSVDAMDVSGAQQFDVITNLYKKRLHKDGTPVEDEPEKNQPAAEQVGLGDKSPEIADALKKPNSTYCGSCYGAETAERKCCNTCDQVREAYREAKWAITNYDAIEQCVREGFLEKAMAQADEGCNVFGYLEVNKVAGNFHLAPGKSFQQHNVHVHDVESLRHVVFNMSHTVNSLSFGTAYPGIINPLDGYHKASPNIGMMYQYYIKIVPTYYMKANGEAVKTNQFSSTLHERTINYAAGDHGLPGVFFNYDLSPILVNITESRRPLLQFLTNLCAIVGGVFTVSGIVDSVIYRSSRALKKMELGKER